jgi:hypothetical protein
MERSKQELARRKNMIRMPIVFVPLLVILAVAAVPLGRNRP